MKTEVLFQQAVAMSFILKVDFLLDGGLFMAKCWYDAGGCLVDIEVFEGFRLGSSYNKLDLDKDDPILEEAERLLSEMNIAEFLTC